ncbi:MAG TPA: YdhR family protein [Miltoncostaeaceae bacterium]|nr:YdhR family protein [Miltoncostaeaceae bacterium]
MHVLIINFHLADMSEEGYRAGAAELAPAFARVPGLLAKLWLHDDASGTYGGVYLFRDRQAVQDYLASELLAGVAASPNFVDITSRDFAIYEDLSRVTQPGLELLAEAVA